MTRHVFNTAQVAHIWAQGRQEEGRNSARRVYFEGPFLYSYGNHFLTGYRLPDGNALLNSARYSVSTSGHQSDAKNAVTGQGFSCANIAKISEFMDSRVFRLPRYTWPDGVKTDSRYGREGFSPSEARGPEREPLPLQDRKALAPALFDILAKQIEPPQEETSAALFGYLGLSDKEAATKARKLSQIHQTRAKEAAESAAKKKRDSYAELAKNQAARPLDYFQNLLAEKRAAILQGVKTRNLYLIYRKGEVIPEAEVLDIAKELFRARKEARARKWKKIDSALIEREKLLRAGALALVETYNRATLLNHWAGRVADYRAGLAELESPFPQFGPLKNGELAALNMRGHILQAIMKEQDSDLGEFHQKLAQIAKAFRFDLPQWAAALGAMAESLNSKANWAAANRSRLDAKEHIAQIRQFQTAPESLSNKQLEQIAKGRFNLAGYPLRLKWARPIVEKTGKAAQELLTARKSQAVKEALEAWRNGAPHFPALPYDPNAGALLRALNVERDATGQITGGRLSTSQGAEAPLLDAIRVFQFLKLCRENSKAWRANGRILEAGHFRIDLIESNGDFRAGCHGIKWAEVESLAARLGVLDLAPADTTENRAA